MTPVSASFIAVFLTFNDRSNARLPDPFSYLDGQSVIERTIDELPYQMGTTSTDEALSQARNEIFGHPGDRVNVLNVVIIITDGVPFPDARRQPTINAATDLQRVATMFSVGITNNIDMRLLSLLSSHPRLPNRNYFSTLDFDELDRQLLPLLESVCVSPTPPPCKRLFEISLFCALIVQMH